MPRICPLWSSSQLASYLVKYTLHLHPGVSACANSALSRAILLADCSAAFQNSDRANSSGQTQPSSDLEGSAVIACGFVEFASCLVATLPTARVGVFARSFRMYAALVEQLTELASVRAEVRRRPESVVLIYIHAYIHTYMRAITLVTACRMFQTSCLKRVTLAYVFALHAAPKVCKTRAYGTIKWTWRMQLTLSLKCLRIYLHVVSIGRRACAQPRQN